MARCGLVRTYALRPSEVTVHPEMQTHTWVMRHLTMCLSKIRRSKKQSLGSGIAYVLRRTFTDHRTGRTFNYSKKGGLLSAGISGWEGSAAELAVAASAAERRCDAVEGRTFILGLPHELPVETMDEMVTIFAERLAKNHGVAAVYALHAPDPEGDPRNYHAHVVFTSRRVGEDGRSLVQKTREWDTAPGSKLIEEAREFWCSMCNDVLAGFGYAADIEHKSFERLGIRRPPTKHVGERMTAVRRHAKRVHREAPPCPASVEPLHQDSGFRALPWPVSAEPDAPPTAFRPLPTPRPVQQPAFRPFPTLTLRPAEPNHHLSL